MSRVTYYECDNCEVEVSREDIVVRRVIYNAIDNRKMHGSVTTDYLCQACFAKKLETERAA